MYWAMLTHAEKDGIGAEAFASISGITSGGASMPVDIMRRFDARFGTEIREGYGLSETSPAATTHAPGMPRKPGSVGTPLWGVQVRIVDDDGVELPLLIFGTRAIYPSEICGGAADQQVGGMIMLAVGTPIYLIAGLVLVARDLLSDTKEGGVGVGAAGKKYEIMRDSLVGMYVKDVTSEPVHTASHCRTL